MQEAIFVFWELINPDASADISIETGVDVLLDGIGTQLTQENSK